MSGLVLIAHADPGELGLVAEACRTAGWSVVTAETLETACTLARGIGPEVVWLDGRLATDPVERVTSLRRLAEPPQPPARVLVGWSAEEIEPSRAPTILAPAESLTTPFAWIDGADRERRRWLVRAQLELDLERGSPAPLVGRSPAIRRLRDQIDRIAATPRTTVLLLGEPGTGRLELARHVHALSDTDGPLVEVSCALPGRAFDLELFGSNAARDIGRSGACALAREGSLVLRDVERLGPEAQARVLELATDRTWRAIGSEEERPLETRLIALASPELEAVVESGAFREDLFYRLNVLSSNVPALRERPQDVEALARHHLARLRVPGGSPTLVPAALEALERHTWPGNERELRATLERAAWMAGSQPIRAEHLGLSALRAESPAGPDSVPVGDGSLRSVEERLIRHVLSSTGGNRSRTARILGVNRTTLYNKLRTYGIDG